MPKKNNYLYAIPIGNMELTKAVDNEFRVNRVTFVSQQKLPYIRKRLGIPYPLSRLPNSFSWFDKDYFKKASTYAIVNIKGEKVKDTKEEIFNIVKDELAFVSLGQLGYSKRGNYGTPSVWGEHLANNRQYVVFDKNAGWGGWGGHLTGNFLPFTLTGMWKVFQTDAFFIELRKLIFEDKTSLQKNWKRELHTASILIGNSIGSSDISTAFINNMIALEIILTRQGDKISKTLISRSEALLGWGAYWEAYGYNTRIKDIYDKRNRFVHDGNREDITIEDLKFTDHLLFNILVNLVKHPILFNSKQAIIDFARKIEAEKILGVKSKLMPKNFVFHHNYRNIRRPNPQ